MRPRQSASPNDRAQVLTGAVAEVSRRLELGPSMLGRIIGISQSSASRLLAGTYELREVAKEWELSAALVRVYRSLFALVGGDEALAKDWLRAPNRALAGEAPANLLARVDGLLRVCEYLDAHRLDAHRARL